MRVDVPDGVAARGVDLSGASFFCTPPRGAEARVAAGRPVVVLLRAGTPVRLEGARAAAECDPWVISVAFANYNRLVERAADRAGGMRQ